MEMMNFHRHFFFPFSYFACNDSQRQFSVKCPCSSVQTPIYETEKNFFLLNLQSNHLSYTDGHPLNRTELNWTCTEMFQWKWNESIIPERVHCDVPCTNIVHTSVVFDVFDVVVFIIVNFLSLKYICQVLVVPNRSENPTVFANIVDFPIFRSKL